MWIAIFSNLAIKFLTSRERERERERVQFGWMKASLRAFFIFILRPNVRNKRERKNKCELRFIFIFFLINRKFEVFWRSFVFF